MNSSSSTAPDSSDVVTALVVALGDAIGQTEMPASHVAALNVVHHNEGVSISYLAASLGLSHSATVRVVDRLVEDRLLTRERSGPGRQVALHLTADGTKAAQAASKDRSRVIDKTLAALSDDERARFLTTVRRLLRALVLVPETGDRICRLCDQQRCLERGCPLPWTEPSTPPERSVRFSA